MEKSRYVRPAMTVVALQQLSPLMNLSGRSIYAAGDDGFNDGSFSGSGYSAGGSGFDDGGFSGRSGYGGGGSGFDDGGFSGRSGYGSGGSGF